jgi:hypothetical protein
LRRNPRLKLGRCLAAYASTCAAGSAAARLPVVARALQVHFGAKLADLLRDDYHVAMLAERLADATLIMNSCSAARPNRSAWRPDLAAAALPVKVTEEEKDRNLAGSQSKASAPGEGRNFILGR